MLNKNCVWDKSISNRLEFSRITFLRFLSIHFRILNSRGWHDWGDLVCGSDYDLGFIYVDAAEVESARGTKDLIEGVTCDTVEAGAAL